MIRWESGHVIAPLDAWPGAVRVRVRIDPAPGAETEVAATGPEGEVVRALAYTALTGAPEPGERVLLNTNALRRGLGTGGDALVIARPEALLPPPAEPAAGEEPPHMMKMRYAPGQVMVDAIDDPASEHHARMLAARDLGGMPVVVADLHSSLPAIVAGIRATAPRARIAYLLTDGAALPAWYSRTLAALRAADLVACCLSAGQAFGGDLEAVSVPSALLGARHVVGADVTIAIQGPGNLGTGTDWGFSGVQAADVLNAAHVLGGRPVGALRVSDADARSRHRELSHHSATTYGRLVHVPCVFPVPPAEAAAVLHGRVREQVRQDVLDPAAARGLHHELRHVATEGLAEALAEIEMPPAPDRPGAAGIRLSTMGRRLEEDPNAFLYAALAGRAAAQLIPAAAPPGPAGDSNPAGDGDPAGGGASAES